MKFSEIFKSKQESVPVAPEPIKQEEKKEYNPKLGDANRYENARGLNKELAEKINGEALSIVNTAMSVLEKLEKKPELKNFHDPITEGKWIGDYLKDKSKEILDLYGVSGASGLEEPHATGVPREVPYFLTRVYRATK
jgi:hypothetical protein